MTESERAAVMTVLGPVPAAALGPTLAHEHVFFDLRTYFTPADDGSDAAFADAPLAPERLWWLRTHPMNSRPNLVHQDVTLAVAEVGHFAAAGGGTLVDVTTVGIAPDPAGLAEVSRRTGVHIVAGTGFYIAGSYPAEVAELSVEALEAHLTRELTEGIGATAVRAGMIGELGVGNPASPFEQRLLAAAARVQRARGCAVSLHPSWGAEGVRAAVAAGEAAGLDPARTALCHLDNRLREDVATFRDLGRRGYYLELDCFGRDCYYPHVDTQLPADAERLRVLLALLESGLERQVLVAQDICFAHELVANGGHGYAHVMRSIVPRLRRAGAGAETIDTLLVHNPRRWLAGG